jgi:hypothetical protein
MWCRNSAGLDFLVWPPTSNPFSHHYYKHNLTSSIGIDGMQLHKSNKNPVRQCCIVHPCSPLSFLAPTAISTTDTDIHQLDKQSKQVSIPLQMIHSLFYVKITDNWDITMHWISANNSKTWSNNFIILKPRTVFILFPPNPLYQK